LSNQKRREAKVEENGRFAGLEVDFTEGVIEQEAPVDEVVSTRWSSPEVDGHTVEQFEGYSEKRMMSDYVVGGGPASRALQVAGLHYPITLEPLGVVSGLPCVDDGRYFAVYDHGSKRMLGRPVTKQYRVAQNATMAAMIDAIVPDDTQVSVTGFGHGEKIAFEVDFSMNGDGDDLVTEETKERVRRLREKYNVGIHGWEGGGDYVPPHESKMVVVNTHGGFGKVFAKMAFRFKVCDNGLCRDLQSGGFAFTHSAYLDERIEQARRAFELARDNAGQHQELFARMFGTHMNAPQFTSFVEEMFPETKKIRENARSKAKLDETRDRFRKVYLEAPGSAPNSLYGALAASTYWTTHELEVRKVKGEQAVAKRYELQIEGRGDKINQQALNWCHVQLQEAM
jgi:hypothetical protein